MKEAIKKGQIKEVKDIIDRLENIETEDFSNDARIFRITLLTFYKDRLKIKLKTK